MPLAGSQRLDHGNEICERLSYTVSLPLICKVATMLRALKDIEKACFLAQRQHIH